VISLSCHVSVEGGGDGDFFHCEAWPVRSFDLDCRLPVALGWDGVADENETEPVRGRAKESVSGTMRGCSASGVSGITILTWRGSATAILSLISSSPGLSSCALDK
jgi:hypothetical protein